jgi:hypothetical protein
MASPPPISKWRLRRRFHGARVPSEAAPGGARAAVAAAAAAILPLLAL